MKAFAFLLRVLEGCVFGQGTLDEVGVSAVPLLA